MNKQLLIDEVLSNLEQSLANALQAADEAHSNATHAESVAETQYDTLGLENAYLAHGQSMRVEALQHALSLYQQFPLRDFKNDDAINLGALIGVEDLTGNRRYFFLGPAQGGIKLRSHTVEVVLITPETPVGQRLLERYLGDEVSLPERGGFTDYEIVEIS